MLRLARSLLAASSKNGFLSSFNSSQFLSHTNLVLFSSYQKQKIFDMIKKENDEDNFDRIFIEMGSLSDQVREEAVKALLQRVFQGELTTAVIAHEKFKVILKRYPPLMYNAYVHRIEQGLSAFIQFIEQNEDQKEGKLLVKEINDAFAICFETVKKIQSDEAPLQEIQLCQRFAHYHLVYLSTVVGPSKLKGCLTKSKDFYKTTLTKIINHLKVLDEREKRIPESSSQKQEEKEQRQNTIGQIENDRFQLFQSFAESLIELIDAEKELDQLKGDDLKKKQIKQLPTTKGSVQAQKQEIKQQQNLIHQFPKEVIEMESILEKGVLNYNLYKNLKYASKFYHKLKKILLEIRCEKKDREIEESNKTEEEKKTFRQDNVKDLGLKMAQLFQQSFEDFKNVWNELDETQLSEFGMLLVEMKMYTFQLLAAKNVNPNQQLGLQVQKIVNIIEDQTLRKSVLNEMVKEIQSAYQINIERYVENIPRSIRVNRFKRTEEVYQ